MTVVLGLSALAHDPAACLIAGGRLVAAVEEERLNRQKRTTAFPHRAIEHVLRAASLSFDDVEHVAYYWDDTGQLPSTLVGSLRQVPRNPSGMARVVAQRLEGVRARGWLARQLLAHCDGDPGRLPPVTYVDHHGSHLAAARFSAPFQPDGALILDGRGEVAASTLYRIPEPDRAHIVEWYPFPDSLGVFYGAITQLLGYRALADEYKVMGLASYGDTDATMRRRVRHLLQTRPDGRYALNIGLLRPERCSAADLPWLNDRGRRLLGGRYQDRDGSFTPEAFDLAYAAQQALEDAVVGLAGRLSRHGARRLVLAGGVAMNAAAVGRLRASGTVEALHVPLAPGDSGACIGAALALLRRRGLPLPDPSELNGPFLGPRYQADELAALLAGSGWEFRRCAEPARAAADAIADGKIIGWFDGAMEFGERALGARCILADPRDPQVRDRINASVKRRESYRPFAPSVLEEDAPRFFDIDISHRMGVIVRATELASELVPGVVHVDGTARPQTVPKDWPMASFRQLIENFRDRTGVPMVVNTSFNVRGEPIVCSPEDALRCFAASGLDTLFLGPYQVHKSSTATGNDG